jgi:phosphoserine aminotransferase
MTRAMNFGAGPAALPLEALERAQRELCDFDGTHMSVMEHSHRGKAYEKVHDEALALVRQAMGVPDDYDVLFLQGGASLQFAMVPMNLLPAGATAHYVVTGAWGEKAVAEAEVVARTGGGAVKIAATSEKDGNYTGLPSEVAPTDGAAYVHVTSNETIHGVQYALDSSTPFPARAPLVCDMSSDILGRVVDVRAFDMIYAGAQKNIGPSGVTLVIAKKSLLEAGRADAPVVLQYRTHAEARSLYNTPPTFGIYLVRNVLSWLMGLGGVEAIEKRNRAKAKELYAAIDGSGGFYRSPVDVAARSIMNVVFRLPTPELEAELVKAAEAEGMIGLKGHRSVGGLRASLYNAVEPAWVSALADFMKSFAAKRG